MKRVDKIVRGIGKQVRKLQRVINDCVAKEERNNYFIEELVEDNRKLEATALRANRIVGKLEDLIS